MESAAAEIMTYEAQVIPDLLQTDDYARAIAAAEPGYATDQQREDAVAAKAMRRQVVLGGTSAGRRLSVILGEARAAPGRRRPRRHGRADQPPRPADR